MSSVPCAGCALQISREWEMNTDNVMEWKLVDVPELGYFTTDKPHPRGELVLKTRGLIKGYFKHPKVRTHHSISAVNSWELGVQARVLRSCGEATMRHGFGAAASNAVHS